jgi:archaellum component FlaC
MENKFNAFLDRHQIKIINQTPWYSYNSPHYNFFDDKYNYNVVSHNVRVEQQQMFTVTIPEKQLTKMQEFEDQVYNNMTPTGHWGLLETLARHKEEEERLRKQFPAVQLAYEKYSMMLNLCKGEQNGNK